MKCLIFGGTMWSDNMKNIITFLIFFTSMAHFTSLHAEDIEIYQGGNNGVRPNVMLLMDTSESMIHKVQIEGTFYDPTEVYPGPFRNDRLYFYELPETGSDAFDIKAIRDAILPNTIHPDSFKCESKRNELFNAKGFAVSKFLQWNPDQAYQVGYRVLRDVDPGWRIRLRWVFDVKENNQGVWRTLKTSDNPNHYVDCELDTSGSNRHGLNANDGKPYMTHRLNNQPYTSDSGIRIRGLINLGWYLIRYPFSQIEPASAIGNRGMWTCVVRLCAGATETVYTGNYLNWDFATQNGQTSVKRLYLMGQILSDTVAQYPGLNVGLARFDGRLLGDLSINIDGDLFTNPITYEAPEGGMIAINMVPSDTNALRFENTVKSWDPWGMTPLTESYYEVARYMRGENPKYGNNTRIFKTRDSFLGLGGRYHDYPSIPASRTNNSSTGSYESPITKSCQDNHIIVFSDGAPTNDDNANSDIRNLISGLTDLPAGLSKSCSGHGGCIEELAHFLASEDQSPLPGTQTIKTHSIFGFTENSSSTTFLQNLSEKYGQGVYGDGKDEDAIRAEFRKVFDSITGSSSSFTAPVVSVNSFNRFELSDELYYSVFKPSGNLSWKGNLKRYRMRNTNTSFAVLDANDEEAIDTDTGYFKSTARSFWTPVGEKDGKEVTKGGIANRLPQSRNIYTSPLSSSSTNIALRPLNTSTATKAQLDITSKDTTYHQELITWAIGNDKKSIEDPLHSEPTIITYEDSNGNEKRALFVGTNSGFLHAFDIDKNTPNEYFAFIPAELLANLNQYYTGGGINAKKVYGVDGPITHFHEDTNKDGKVNGGEKVYLYVGLRRGGQSAYALDVSNLSSPKLLWQIHGNYPSGTLNKPSISTGYENLGQTWGRLEPAYVNYNGSPKLVLFTSGGYDPKEDGQTSLGTSTSGPLTRIDHTQGTTIYMIDAITGNVLWDAKKHTSVGPQMKSSFPANVAPLDTDTVPDGLADLLYAADVGGRIWRFDFSAKTDNFINDSSGSIVADLNAGSNSENRRIYNEIDVIGTAEPSDKTIYLSVGTGNRSHPNHSLVQNYHYVIKDITTPQLSRGVLTHSDLAKWDENGRNTSSNGWYIPLNRIGEKALSRSNTVANQIIFSTFAPKPVAEGVCDVSPGYAKSYKLDLTRETFATADMNNGGIPPMPMLLPPPSKLDCGEHCRPTLPPATYSVLVGTEVVTFEEPVIGTDLKFDQLYWLEKPYEKKSTSE